MATKTSSLSIHAKPVLLVVLLTVALIARFRYLAQIEHNVDHAYPIWQAMMTLEQGEFPLAGQGTSVLFANPALTGYLFLPVVALTRSPIGVYSFVIALNWLAVWMTYRTARALSGEWVALVAAALIAVNPWVIEYSRTSWVQSLLPFFVCAVAWLLWPVLLGQSKRPTRRLILALVMTALLTQTYLLAYFILASVGLLLVLFRRRIPRRGLLIGGAVIALFTALYGIGLLGQMDTVAQRLRDFSSGDSRLTAEAWAGAVRLVTGGNYALARGVDAPAGDSTFRHALSQVAHLAILGAVLLGLGMALFRLRYPGSGHDAAQTHAARTHAARTHAALILLLWFGLPILAMSYSGNPVHTFYQLLGLPAGYILAAWGFGLVFRLDYSRWGRVLFGVLFIPFAALMLTNSARYSQETAAHPGAHGLFALPVDYGLQMGRLVRESLPDNGVVFAQAEGWIINSFAGDVFPVMWDTRAPRFYIVPESGGVYITMDNPPPELRFAYGTQTLSLQDDSLLRVTTLSPAPAARATIGQPILTQTQQGLTLLAYDLTQAQDTTTLTTYWAVGGIMPEVLEHTYAPFIHIFDAAGTLALIVDGEGLPGYAWREGDLHVHQMTFTLPEDSPAPFTLKLGQFDGVNNANLVFLPSDAASLTVPDVVVTLPETLTR